MLIQNNYKKKVIILYIILENYLLIDLNLIDLYLNLIDINLIINLIININKIVNKNLKVVQNKYWKEYKNL